LSSKNNTKEEKQIEKKEARRIEGFKKSYNCQPPMTINKFLWIVLVILATTRRTKVSLIQNS
jgi:hypothetical protein